MKMAKNIKGTGENPSASAPTDADMMSEPGDNRSPFEAIRHVDDDGREYWFARDMGRLLDYSQWQAFKVVIERARVSCINSKQQPEDHFIPAHEMIPTGKGARRSLPSYKLSRYACYLIIQNADPNKEIVALGQTYFVVQVRRQEQADELAGLTENQKRIYLRYQLADHNKQLATTARGAGVITPRDFAVFTDAGYQGLYNGLGQREIRVRKGLAKTAAILDHAGSEDLAANLFRSAQAEAKIRREGVQGKAAANRTHFEVGRGVWRTIEEFGGAMPEDLPTPEKSIQQLDRDRTARARLQSQPALFDEVIPEE